MVTRVWRVEDAEGRGPYHQATKLEQVFGVNWDYVSPQRPRHGVGVDGPLRYVFLNKRQLLDWFDVGMLKALIRLGYRVRSYVVDDVVVGDKQGVVRGPVWRERKPRW